MDVTLDFKYIGTSSYDRTFKLWVSEVSGGLWPCFHGWPHPPSWVVWCGLDVVAADVVSHLSKVCSCMCVECIVFGSCLIAEVFLSVSYVQCVTSLDCWWLTNRWRCSCGDALASSYMYLLFEHSIAPCGLNKVYLILSYLIYIDTYM